MYRLRYLPSVDLDMEEAEAYLGGLSLSAADKLSAEFECKTDALTDNPLMYQVYESRPYFRCMPLPYDYLCFYHVDAGSKTISIHRILRGMRDIPKIL